MITNPRISIITATYNRAHFILETLKSIQKQTFLDWECLIVNDGGTDSTENIIQELLTQDNRFKFLERPNTYLKGLPGCRNYGLDIAKGDYIIFFDDDDLVNENLLAIALENIFSHKVSFCHYQKKSFQKELQIIENKSLNFKYFLSKDNLTDVLQQKIGLASCTVLWKRECFSNIRFNENLMYAEEWECYSKILSEGFLGIVIPNILYYNRKHPQSNTHQFYQYNAVRRASKAEAILLVIENLQEKKILSNSILRYFVTMSSDFKEFDLFSKIMHLLEEKRIRKILWILFYYSLPTRLIFYKIKKSLIKK